MGYCVLDDVNNLVPQQPFSATSVPTDAQVQQFIDDVAAEIDATLVNLGYVTPIDPDASPLATALVVQANKWGALGIAQDARFTGVVMDTAVGGARNAWTTRYETWKKALRDPQNPFTLTDAVRNAFEIVKPGGEVEAGSRNHGYAHDAPFRIGMKFVVFLAVCLGSQVVSPMETLMGRTSHQNQIFGTVVGPDAVDVVRTLIVCQRTTDGIGHDQTVFKDVAIGSCVRMIRTPDDDVAQVRESSTTFPRVAIRSAFSGSKRLLNVSPETAATHGIAGLQPSDRALDLSATVASTCGDPLSASSMIAEVDSENGQAAVCLASEDGWRSSGSWHDANYTAVRV